MNNEQKTEAKETEPAQKKGFASFLSRAQDVGKKAADGIQKGAKSLSEQAQKSMYEQRMKKYNPLFEDAFKSDSFKLPNIIQIVDAAARKDVDVCDGAIGWTKIVNDVEILFIYEEWAEKCNVSFLPFPKCDTVYCIDPLDHRRYINSTTAFDTTTNEKLAELSHVAECLGAKKCKVEILETSAQASAGSASIKIPIGSASKTADSTSQTVQGGRREDAFSGNSEPKMPTLKWFAHDDNITGLIENKLSGKNSSSFTRLELFCSSATTMSEKSACAIDKIAKISGSASMEKRAQREMSSKLIFEIEF